MLIKLLKRLTVIGVLFIAVQVASAQTSNSGSTNYNAVKDYSIASNPNGVWSYGYLTKAQTPFILYTWSDNQCLAGMSWWGLLRGPCDALPVVGHNDTDRTICWSTDCLPPNYLVVAPGSNGEISVVRWTAPSQGLYKIQAAAMGIDCGPTTTDFRAVLNTTRQLFVAAIDSCNLPISFERQLGVSTGDTLDFMVDWGENHTPYGDSTGVQIRISRAR